MNKTKNYLWYKCIVGYSKCSPYFTNNSYKIFKNEYIWKEKCIIKHKLLNTLICFMPKHILFTTNFIFSPKNRDVYWFINKFL